MNQRSLQRHSGAGATAPSEVRKPDPSQIHYEHDHTSERPYEHGHVHSRAHAVADGCEACATAFASMVTSTHRESWELAVEQYDRTHPVGPARQAHGTTGGTP